MLTYWKILVSTLIPTLHVSICKIKYQSMSDHYANHYLLIIMQITICLMIMQITICMINCADYHLSDHHANIIQLSKL